MKYLLDNLASQNDRKQKILNEKMLQYSQEAKDAIGDLNIDERVLSEEYEQEIRREGIDTMRVSLTKKFPSLKNNRDPTDLFPKYIYFKKTHELIKEKCQEEKEATQALKAKIQQLQNDIVYIIRCC